MRKRIILILVLILIGAAAWYLYTKSKTADPAGSNGIFNSFFPVGNGGSTNPDGTLPDGSEQTIDIPSQSQAAFKQLSPHTIAGFGAFTTTTVVTIPATTPGGKPTKETVVDHIVRYVSRTSGYVYEMKNGGTPIQISNIYIPNVYEASLADGGNSALLRFLREDKKTIATYRIPIPPQNTDGTRTQKDGSYFPDNIESLAISPDGSAIARTTTERDSAVLSTTTTTNAKRKEIIRSPFHEWLVSWSGKSDLYLQTKASALADGFFYTIDQSKKRLVRIVGDVPGLTTSVSPSGAYILYSQSVKNGFITKLLNAKTGITTSIGSSILPEKCVWLKNEDLICAGGGYIPNGTYPDDWYAGTVHFSDQLFRIYTASQSFDVLSSPTDTQSFDMTMLQTNETLGVLYFVDKNTGLLWQFTL